MPFYRYTAQDATGKMISGALEAATPDAAASRLTGMGLARVAVEGARAAAPVAPRPVATPPVGTARPRPVVESAASPSIAREEFAVPIASPRERAFFFDQLGRFINSGIGASKALETLGSQTRGRGGEFLLNAARNAAAGNGLGESLRGGYITEAERDALTASERGGYVPQTCARLSDIAMDAHRLGRGLAYPLVMIALALFAGPCTRGVQDASMNSMVRQDQAGGSLPAGGTFAQEWGKTAPGTIALSLVLIALFYLSVRLWIAPFNRALRHRLSLGVWPLGPRARSESTAQLAIHLAGLSAAGISPQEAVRLAAATLPNLALRAAAMRELGNVPAGLPLSQAIAGTGLVSAQYRDMISNGELTGDVPGALGMVARVEEGEYINRSKFAGKGIFVILMIVAAVAVALTLGFAARYWYSNIIRIFTNMD